MIKSSYALKNSKLPIFATAIHNGHRFPQELLPSCGISDRERFMEEDPYTCGFAGMFPNYGIVLTSRFAVDLNRNRDKCVYLIPEDAWGLPVRSSEIPPDLLERLYASYDTWYKIARHQIENLLKHNNKLLILDIHSYNHRRGGMDAAPDPQIDNPDIIIGRNNLSEELYPRIETLRNRIDGIPFLDRSIDCRCDIKFSGGHFSRWVNSSYPGRCICLAIEFKKLFMNEWTDEFDLQAYNEMRLLFYEAVMDCYYQILAD